MSSQLVRLADAVADVDNAVELLRGRVVFLEVSVGLLFGLFCLLLIAFCVLFVALCLLGVLRPFRRGRFVFI
jgi:hypothetical protein